MFDSSPVFHQEITDHRGPEPRHGPPGLFLSELSYPLPRKHPDICPSPRRQSVRKDEHPGPKRESLVGRSPWSLRLFVHTVGGGGKDVVVVIVLWGGDTLLLSFWLLLFPLFFFSFPFASLLAFAPLGLVTGKTKAEEFPDFHPPFRLVPGCDSESDDVPPQAAYFEQAGIVAVVELAGWGCVVLATAIAAVEMSCCGAGRRIGCRVSGSS